MTWFHGRIYTKIILPLEHLHLCFIAKNPVMLLSWADSTGAGPHKPESTLTNRTLSHAGGTSRPNYSHLFSAVLYNQYGWPCFSCSVMRRSGRGGKCTATCCHVGTILTNTVCMTPGWIISLIQTQMEDWSFPHCAQIDLDAGNLGTRYIHSDLPHSGFQPQAMKVPASIKMVNDSIHGLFRTFASMAHCDGK